MNKHGIRALVWVSEWSDQSIDHAVSNILARLVCDALGCDASHGRAARTRVFESAPLTDLLHLPTLAQVVL